MVGSNGNSVNQNQSTAKVISKEDIELVDPTYTIKTTENPPQKKTPLGMRRGRGVVPSRPKAKERYTQ